MDFIDIHSHTNSDFGLTVLNVFPSDDVSELQGKHFSTGLHPWYIDVVDYIKKIEFVRSAAKRKSCIAIGETGLDKLAKTDFDLQRIVFENHIEIAGEMGKPIIIHCVRAFDDLISIKKSTGSIVPWIVHGYNSNLQIAETLIKEGMMLSFGKALGNPLSNARKVLMVIPKNVFFLETDDSQFSIQKIYELAAKIRKTSDLDLSSIILGNFQKTFSLQNE